MKIVLLLAGMFASITSYNNQNNSLTYATPDHPPIVIRHDKSDAEYLALGKKFPSVCKVGKRGGDGTLIAPQWIMTAAHVAQGMFRRQGKDLKIYFENKAEGYLIDKIFIHPDFAPMQGADIALILLKKPVQGIDPAQWYTQKNEAGKNIIIVGHGDFKNGKGGEWVVDGKKRGATNVIDEATSNKIIFDFDEPPGGTELEGTAGRGDSGGPAFIMKDNIPFIAGISSAGMPGKNGPGTYGAVEHYTRVSSYQDWIKSTIENPALEKALSKNDLPSPNRKRNGNPRIQGPGSDPLPGLGLMLMEENGKIRIGGKADSMVPKTFRQVMFRPPSFIESFNGKSYTSLEQFKQDFNKLKKGENFKIKFKIQGKVQSFEGRKM